MKFRFSRLVGVLFGGVVMLAGAAWGQTAQEPVQGLIVKLKPSSAASGVRTRESSATASHRLMDAVRSAGVSQQGERGVGSQGHHLVRLASPESGSQLQATMERLRQQPDVLSVEPDVRIKRLAVPNDPGFTNQWHLAAPSSIVPPALNMPLAWDTTTGSSAITVAVVDTGVRYAHPDLAGRLLPGYDFVSDSHYSNDGDGRDNDATDPGDWVSSSDRTGQPTYFSSCAVEDSSWHGTFITGQLAAVANNSQGVAGMTWNGQVLPVRVAGKCGALLSDLLDGLRWAAGLAVAGAPTNTHPARVINLSFGGDAPCTTAYQDVINEITNAGALLVVAAGNESSTPMRPADCKRVLTMGSVQEDGRKTYYSNVGAAVGLSAPGGSNARPLYSTLPRGTTSSTDDTTYGQYLGTSFSAPLGAGVAALMLAVNPQLTPDQLITRMRQTARPFVSVAGAPSCATQPTVACNCSTSLCGAGMLDAAAAVASAANSLATLAVINPVATVAPGATVQLDGSKSSAAAGATLSAYQWTQVSGTAVTVQNATSSVASVTLPAVAGSFTFQLMVTDSAGRTAQSTVTVVSAVDVASVSSAGGGGGGAIDFGWGVALWLWVGAVWWSWRRRQRAQKLA